MTDRSGRATGPWSRWDRMVASRVGAFLGGLAGAVVMVVTGSTSPWLLLGGALIGGLVGYGSRRQRG